MISENTIYPEEKIRQSIIKFMVLKLLYPKELISIERSLSSFPHLKGRKLPNRRFDIAVFAKKVSSPLMVIECKAVPLNQKALDQLIGYNYYVQAPFIALANGKEVITYVKKGEKYIQYKGLPMYKVLLENVGDR